MFKRIVRHLRAKGSSYLVVMLIAAMAGAAILYFTANRIKGQATSVTSSTTTLINQANSLQR